MAGCAGLLRRCVEEVIPLDAEGWNSAASYKYEYLLQEKWQK
jgi:hypothetical protein